MEENIIKAPKKTKAKTRISEVQFCVYLGPTILRYVQHGAVFRGTKADALAALSEAVEQYPQIRQLIVTDMTLPEAKTQINAPGNLLYAKRQELAAVLRKGKKKDERFIGYYSDMLDTSQSPDNE